MTARLFSALRKDATVNSVHVTTALGNEKPKRKARLFRAVTTGYTQKRALQPNDASTAKTPFVYDVNALGSLRPDQVPRFFGSLTDSDKLPTKEVQLKDLHAMQDRVDPAKVQAIAQNGAAGKLPVVVQHNGRQYIADGHHRLAAQWLAGKDQATVRFKDLEPVSNALKRDTRVPVKVAKVDESLGLVFGWAIVCKVDGQDYYDLNVDHAGSHEGQLVPEHITEPAMLKGALGFAEGERAGNELHEGPDVGQYPFVFPLTTDIAKAMLGVEPTKTGMMVAYKPPANVLAKFLSGEYRGFSIEGKRLAWEHRE